MRQDLLENGVMGFMHTRSTVATCIDQQTTFCFVGSWTKGAGWLLHQENKELPQCLEELGGLHVAADDAAAHQSRRRKAAALCAATCTKS
jgi:hypothetical protein